MPEAATRGAYKYCGKPTFPGIVALSPPTLDVQRGLDCKRQARETSRQKPGQVSVYEPLSMSGEYEPQRVPVLRRPRLCGRNNGGRLFLILSFMNATRILLICLNLRRRIRVLPDL